MMSVGDEVWEVAKELFVQTVAFDQVEQMEFPITEGGRKFLENKAKCSLIAAHIFVTEFNLNQSS